MFAQAHTRSETTATRHSVSSPLTPIAGGRGIQSSLFLNNFLGYLRGHLAWASWDPEALAKRPLTPCPTEEPPPHNHPPASTTTPSRAKHHHHPSVSPTSVSFYTFFFVRIKTVSGSRNTQLPSPHRPPLPPPASLPLPHSPQPRNPLGYSPCRPRQPRTGQNRAGQGWLRPLSSPSPLPALCCCLRARPRSPPRSRAGAGPRMAASLRHPPWARPAPPGCF